jgi:hypothetical protein
MEASDRKEKKEQQDRTGQDYRLGIRMVGGYLFDFRFCLIFDIRHRFLFSST